MAGHFKTREERKLLKKQKRYWLVIYLILFLLGTGSTLYFTHNHSRVSNALRLITRQTTFPGKEKLNILFLGVDEDMDSSRTDTIILANLSLKNPQLNLLSIPRDTRVKIPGRGMDKINAAHVYGGSELTIKTVENLLGISLDYYVLTNFKGFREIVDLLGGVELEVEKRMRYRDRRGGLDINLYPGKQRLDGEEAMEYVRFRHDAEGDIGRIERQQKFIQAVYEQMLQPAKLVRIPGIIHQLQENLETNLALSQMVELASLAKKVEQVKIKRATIPGTSASIRGISYWQADKEETEKIVDELIKGISSSQEEGRED